MPITLLYPTDNSPTTKIFSARDDGTISKISYKTGPLFNVDIREVDNIYELSDLLTTLEHESSCFIIRGLPHPETNLLIPTTRILRASTPPPHFIDTLQNWLMIDIDSLDLPTGMDAIESPAESIEYTIEQLPEEFHNATCHWQFSSSHGVPKHKDDQPITDRVKIHLWFWLDRGITTYDLKEWSKKYNLIYSSKLIDNGLYNAVQPNYITKPIFETPLEDPLSIRSGLISKELNEVSIKTDIEAPNTTLSTEGSTTDTTTLSSDAHGYENILSELGDHIGGIGFHEPLLRATASLAREKGTEWIDSNMGSIFADLRERINEADQSNHTPEEIDRYRSEKFIIDLLVSAIRSGFGDHTTYYPPYFSKEHLPLSEAESKLSTDIQNFLLDAHEHNISSNDNAPNLAIKASAGLGKTIKTILFTTHFNLFTGKNIEYYVPTHALAEELEPKLRNKLEELITKAGASIDNIQLQVISGRNRETGNGGHYCLKHEQAQKLVDARLSVEFYLCGSDTDHCEYYHTCKYRKQFNTTSSSPPAIPAINILAHNHLFLRTREKLPKPSLIIIDESFFRVGINETSIVPTILRRCGSSIARTIFDTLYDEKPLLKQLRDKGINPALLRDEAGNFTQENPAISPTSSYRDQQDLIGKLEQPDHIDTLLNTLAYELEVTDRDDSYSVELIQNTTSRIDTIEIHTREELNIPIDVPVLFIDADANHNLINLFRPNTPLVEIAAERQAKVHQFKNTFSQFWLDRHPETIEQLKSFIQNIGQYSNTLVVTTKGIRLQLTGEIEANIERIGECESASIIHFQNLRGLDEFKEYNRVIIIGRQQPSGQDMEAQAKALWWDEDAPLTLLPSKSGSRPYDDEVRGYRMRGGSSESIKTKYHPDRRVQDLLELTREHEIAQAIDRLRLVREKNFEPMVYILTSIPLDITVDHLWDWKHLQEFIKLWETSDGVIPLNPEHFRICFPGRVETNSGAQKVAARIRNTLPLIELYIRHRDVFSRYKVSPSAKTYSKAIISPKHPDRKKALEDILGMEICDFEPADRPLEYLYHELADI